MHFYRLHELAETTGVTSRTIRYYIAEGLLPPPQGAGPAALYTVGHRDRLRLIAQLKERAITLREIRRRIAKLTDTKVRAELEACPAESAPVGTEPTTHAQPETVQVAITQVTRVQSSPQTPVPPLPFGAQPAPSRDLWERIILAEGIELHIRADRRPAQSHLDALIHHARALLGNP